MKNISQSIRKEFEYRMWYRLKQQDYYEQIKIYSVQDIIHKQTEKLIKYEIENEDSAFLFIEMSFKYPVLQTDELDGSINKQMKSKMNDLDKIKQITNILIFSQYVSEF